MPQLARPVGILGVLCFVPCAALAGPPKPSFTIDVSFNALVLNGASQPEPYYSLFPGISVQGFSDEFNPGNLGRVMSDNGAFWGATNSGSSSVAYTTFAALLASLNDGQEWTIEIIDGGTNIAYTYTFSLNSSSLLPDHMRPLSLTNVVPGGGITLNPTFTWTIAPAADPGNPFTQFDLAVASLFGPALYSSPPLSPADASWTPAGPIVPGVYTLVVQFQGTGHPDQFLVPTSPQPGPGVPFLEGFTHAGYFGTYCSAPGLVAAPPAQCVGDLDHNGTVDTLDLVLFLGQFGSTVSPGSGGDFDSNGTINTLDLIIFLGNFGHPCA